MVVVVVLFTRRGLDDDDDDDNDNDNDDDNDDDNSDKDKRLGLLVDCRQDKNDGKLTLYSHPGSGS